MLILGKNYVSIKNQRLECFSYSKSGDMRGGYYCMTVKKSDDSHAVIRIEKAEEHNQEPEVSEYVVDASVLDELEQVIRRNKMNYWNKKRFTDMFVSDGASTGYSFEFDKKSIGFSSQIYPGKYRDKLNELREVINEFLKAAGAAALLEKE